MAALNADPVAILVCALGGEGGGVLAEWLYDIAVHAGHSAQSTSIPGVAQRTGATTYYIEVCPLHERELGGRRPVFSLNPVPGAIDLLASSELLETVRQVGNGYASAQRTLVISSTARTYTVVEKMELGDGRVDDAKLLATVQRHARGLELIDMAAMARDAGTVISAVLLGAIAASGVLPFPREAYEEAVRRGGKGVQSSLRGFAAAFDDITARRQQRAQVEALIAPPPPPPRPPVPQAVRERLPEPVHEIATLGYERLVEYQDQAYADFYLDRLEKLVAAERAAVAPDALTYALAREAARWLALWMAYEDLVRVASLKVRASRMERVRREVRAAEGEIVKVYDHFKPGVPELAGMLPDPLARRLIAWDARHDRPWSMPLKLRTHTVHGTLALRLLASMRPLRRIGHRYRTEQQLIEQWLEAVRAGLAQSWTLGHEIAQCGRLIKGYSSTNEHGKNRLAHILHNLAVAPGRNPAERADAIRAIREAALADESPAAFNVVLTAHGVPPQPPPRPIRVYKRRPT